MTNGSFLINTNEENDLVLKCTIVESVESCLELFQLMLRSSIPRTYIESELERIQLQGAGPTKKQRDLNDYVKIIHGLLNLALSEAKRRRILLNHFFFVFKEIGSPLSHERS